jgi:hypothetical protein
MSPTVFIEGKYRFFFNSREETRMHVHVHAPSGVAKFWTEPIISLADYHGVTKRELKAMQSIVEERHAEIERAWKRHFGQ